jgi:Family of unknown function (DUF5681)
MSSQPSVPPDDLEEEPSYQVGYGKPPQATRFQPGKSGNPNGRPRASRKARPADVAVEKLKALALQEAYRPIKIKDGEKLVELPTIQAALRNVTLSAAKGNQRAQRMLFEFVGEVEGERQRDRQKLFEAAVECKQRGEEEIAQARLRGLPAPGLVPHPDHLIVDPVAGSVKLRGPFTPEEKVLWGQLTAMKARIRKELAELEAERRATPRSRSRSLKERIEAMRSRMARIDAILNFERVLV